MTAGFDHTEVNITFTRATSSHGGEYGILQVNDARSGLRVFTIELSPEDSFRFLTGSYITADAEVLPEHLRHRIGRRMVHETIPFPKELVAGYSKEPTAEMVEFAEQARTEGGWDTVSWSRHNFGWGLTGRRWVAVEEPKP